MIDFVFRCLVVFLLWLRYRSRVRGMDAVRAKGATGILFLPNHPALIDPIIVAAYLHKHFRPRFLADQDQVDRPVIRTLAKRIGARRKYGRLSKRSDALLPRTARQFFSVSLGGSVHSVRKNKTEHRRKCPHHHCALALLTSSNVCESHMKNRCGGPWSFGTSSHPWYQLRGSGESHAPSSER